MSITRIATRYAKSLIDLSIERNELDAVCSDIKGFIKVSQNRDFYLLLKSPIVSVDKKKSVFKALFGGKVSQTTEAFYDIIIRKGREPYLMDIAKEFIHQFNAHKGISEVTITTAKPLDVNMLEQIKSKLLKSNVVADKIELQVKINPDILGGFIIETGDKLYDASVSHKLELLKKEFGANQYLKSF